MTTRPRVWLLSLLAAACGDSGMQDTSSGVDPTGGAGPTGTPTSTETGGSTGGSSTETGDVPTTGESTGEPTTGEPVVCMPAAVDVIACDDLTEDPAAVWSHFAEDAAPTTVLPIAGDIIGATAIEVKTESGFAFHVRVDVPAAIDASGQATLQAAIRGLNGNDGAWQINAPVVVIEDAQGQRQTYTPGSQLLGTDGVAFRLIEVPLAGGPGWTVSGGPIDLAQVRAIEIGADTWGGGFELVIDALAFRPADVYCEAACPAQCSGNGTCDVTRLGCVCDLGATGPDCGACIEGYTWDGAHCQLDVDGRFDVWPNAVSRTNGDPWLVAHHAELVRLEPRVLVLHYVNKQDPADSVVDEVIDGFRQGSRHHLYEDPGATPQLEYQVAKRVDLRDGFAGHPPAPDDWQFENSTLYPRVEVDGKLLFDYAALFTAEYAEHYGYADPDQPGEFLTLCELVERGEVNEVWFVGSGDVAGDGAAFEVLEYKQRYTDGRSKISGSFDPCAGNGCFPAEVAPCGRSVKIGFVNYNRGPGCYLHSQGHGLEGLSGTQAVPAFSAWFRRLAALDLDTRHSLPFASAYGVACDQDSTCIDYPAADAATFHHAGQLLPVSPYDAACGNVHFPPNGRAHYDYGGPDTVNSSCARFGEHGVACGVDVVESVDSALWAAYEAEHGDCGGGFLVWWYQNMPAYGAGKTLPDGAPMLSLWPFMFY